MVYCLEDSDNPWVNDHFKSLVLDPAGAIGECTTVLDGTDEPYIGLTVHNSASLIEVDGRHPPLLLIGSITSQANEEVKDIHFIPYALRDNRGGKGHMRVGIRRKH